LLAHGRWFSPGTATSSTTKTGRHDIAEILLKVALNTKNQIKNQIIFAVKTVSLSLFVGVVSSCPSGCNCTDNANGLRVDCSGIGLDIVPTDLPNNTYLL
jgi:hypothetical protein